MPRCLLVLFFSLAIPASPAVAFETCPEPLVVTEVNLPANSHLTSHQQAVVRSRLTGRCFGSKPGQLVHAFLSELENFGYMNAKVSEPTVTVLDSSRYPQPVSLAVQFVEGPRYKIREIRWQGIKAVSIEQIFAISEVRPGDVLDMSKGRETLESVLRLYHSIGYPNVVIVPQTEADEGAGEITLDFSVSEGAYSP